MARKTLLSTKEKASRRRHTISSFKAKVDERRSIAERMADFFTSAFGTVTFLFLNAIFFLTWILTNLGIIPGISIFDPYPYGLLTMIVSLEAIFLAIIVLISQNREARIAELREEVDLYVDTYAESEITKLIYLVTLLLEKNGIDISQDKDVQSMMKSLSSDEIEKELEKQLHRF